MIEIKDLLKDSGYSNKAINYYINKVNVGEIENPDASFSFTGPCGDTAKIFLRIEADVIKDAKFQAIGCAGAFASGSALTKIIKGKTLEEAEKIDEQDILNHIGGMPEQKFHCVCLLRRTLEKAIKAYKKERSNLS
jgi:nitrogen fixation NifU-like protein